MTKPQLIQIKKKFNVHFTLINFFMNTIFVAPAVERYIVPKLTFQCLTNTPRRLECFLHKPHLFSLDKWL